MSMPYTSGPFYRSFVYTYVEPIPRVSHGHGSRRTPHDRLYAHTMNAYAESFRYHMHGHGHIGFDAYFLPHMGRQAPRPAPYDRSFEEAARRREERRRRLYEAQAEMRRKFYEDKDRKMRARRERRAQENKKLADARARYDAAWKRLLDGAVDSELRFEDVPWPTVHTHATPITADAIAQFLVVGPAALGEGDARKARKDKLKETMLRFHPDKFQGRFLRYVREDDRARVLEAVGVVTRCLNTLLAQ